MSENGLIWLRLCECGGWCSASEAAQQAHKLVMGHRFIEKRSPTQGGRDGQEHPDSPEHAPRRPAP